MTASTARKERPILFSAPMVRALLDGSKMQTRRAMKPQPAKKGRWTEWCHKGVLVTDQNVAWQPFETGFPLALSNPGLDWLCPYGQPGDRLWVRETFSGPYCMEAQDGCAAAPPSKWGEDSRLWYWSDGEPTYGDWTRPRPSIHMPRRASRILLEVTDVRVERLQDISEADALAEGIVRQRDDGFGLADTTHYHSADPRMSYWSLWEAINGAGSVEANPWVWTVYFERVTPS